MTHFVKYLVGSVSSSEVAFGPGELTWINEEAEIDSKHRIVLEKLKVLGLDDTISSDFINKCLRQHNGDVENSVSVCKNFVRFRRSVGWGLRVSKEDISETALRSGMHWLLGDRHGRGCVAMITKSLLNKRVILY